MRLSPILYVTALVEGPTGLLLLVWPALVFALLFAWHLPAPETLVMGRIASTGVLSIGIALFVRRMRPYMSEISPRLAGAAILGVGFTALVAQLIPGA